MREGQVGVGDATAGYDGLSAPGTVNIKGVGIAMSHEIVKCCTGQATRTTVRLDHHHLVAVLGVDMVIVDVGNCLNRC